MYLNMYIHCLVLEQNNLLFVKCEKIPSKLETLFHFLFLVQLHSLTIPSYIPVHHS